MDELVAGSEEEGQATEEVDGGRAAEGEEEIDARGEGGGGPSGGGRQRRGGVEVEVEAEAEAALSAENRSRASPGLRWRRPVLGKNEPIRLQVMQTKEKKGI